MSTRLTVILPVYDGMPYLPMAVDSILGQTFTDFTFIIVNDGSTDNSREYLESLRDPRIMLINQSNAGQGMARKVALSRCHSEYVALMDADDISKPDRLRSQLNYLDTHHEVVMLGTQIEFLIGNTAQRALTAPIDHELIQGRLLKGRAGVCTPSLMFRTAAAIQCWDYPSGFLGEDIYFCLRMCEQGRVANLDQVLLQYRLQDAQTSMAKSQEIIRMNHYAVYRAYCRRRGLSEPLLETFLLNASLIERWQWSAEAWELIQYRTGRIRMAGGKRVSGILRLVLLGICRPVSAINHVARAIGALHGNRISNIPR